MSKLWETVLNAFNAIGDSSGCHQIPARCFVVKGYTFPLCARCTGVAVGQLASLVLFLAGLRFPLVMSGALLLCMGADWLVQELGIKHSTNKRRFVTGFCGGFGLFNLYCALASLGLRLLFAL